MDQEPDFNAIMFKDDPASPASLEPDFAAAMNPKKRGRPPKKKDPNTQDPSEPQTYFNNDSIYNTDKDICLDSLSHKDIKALDVVNIKDKLTAQELTFLDLFFNSPRVKGKNRVTIDKCMISAGYGQYSKTTRYLIARKIVGKYEQTAPGAGNIFSALGHGPVKIAQGIIGLAQSSVDKTRIAGLTLAAKCCQMTESQQDRGGGVNIIIHTGPREPQSPAGAGAPAQPVDVVIAGEPQSPAGAQSPAPRKPLQITR